MLKLRKGCKVPHNEKLSEGYMRNGNVIYANVDADKICMLLEELVTAWDTFSAESPGVSENVTTNGKKVYDIPEMFKDWGIYFAERREE